jgi:hypothetical protein
VLDSDTELVVEISDPALSSGSDENGIPNIAALAINVPDPDPAPEFTLLT